jgi:hypothetical protein
MIIIVRHNGIYCETQQGNCEMQQMINDESQLDFVDENGRLKSKSSHRMLYEAQVEVIRKQVGGLENIRENLGLSQRKMAQLLLVDPSAWTRWVKAGEQAPPHIYRALQWYMILLEKIPGLTPSYFLGKDVDGRAAIIHQRKFEEALSAQSLKMEKMIQDLRSENANLRLAVKQNRIGFMMMAFSGIIFALAFYWRYLR